MSIISEEEKQRRRSYWNMAIGLQSANGESPSEYLKELAEKLELHMILQNT